MTAEPLNRAHPHSNRSKGPTHSLCFTLHSSLFVCLALAGCTTPTVKPQWVYFPEPPDEVRAVHLVSFNRLRDVVAPRTTFIEMIRGATNSPLLGTPMRVDAVGERLFICDTALNAVHIWDLQTGRGRLLGLDELRKPVDVVVGDNGSIYVADTYLKQVLVYDQALTLQRRIAGSTGFRPVGLALAAGRLYVADAGGHRIEVFETSSGQSRGNLAATQTSAGGVYMPSGIAIGPTGNVYVADLLGATVQVYDPAGALIRSIGSPGNHLGNLGKPKDVAVSANGVVAVADAEFCHVHLFDSTGRLLMLLGGPQAQLGSTPLPNGVASTETLPTPLQHYIPPGFHPAFFLWITDTTGQYRLSLYAVGRYDPGVSDQRQRPK